MLHVVSGSMRTGTSMMMKALEAGGLEASYRQSREEMRKRFADKHYDPNIGGLYELLREDYAKKNFPQDYDGKLIKGLNSCVPRMEVMEDGIRVVFMLRDPEEIRQSFTGFFGTQLPDHKTYTERMLKIIRHIKNRRDVISMHVFKYREVVDNPKKFFNILKDAGWEIDVDKCAEVVDPKLCRFKKEDLTEGML